MSFHVVDRKSGRTVIAPRDVALGVGGLLVTMFLYGFQSIGDVANMVIWFTAGVCAWGWAFTVAGRLKPREYISDNVRVARHTGFIILTLSLGSAIVGTVEAVAAGFLRPWWLQMPVNFGLTILAFVIGSCIFTSSHDWVLRDPRFEPPLWALNVCVEMFYAFSWEGEPKPLP